jgi:hypothetical protein
MAAYAGIGSRRTPPEILSLMRQTAAALAARGYTLRTGGAGGADQAFLEGAGGPLGQVELFLPWPGFRGSARPERMEGTLGPRWRTLLGTSGSCVRRPEQRPFRDESHLA